MLVKTIIETDFINYKVPSMYIAFPYCDFKCDRENGNQYCHNWKLSQQPNIKISIDRILALYEKARYGGTCALVCAGLEPMQSFNDLIDLLTSFRKITDDPVVIYTGYYPEEIQDKLSLLKQYPKILVKFGRFRPNLSAKLDENLGVTLASSNQYSKWIS